MSRKAIAVIDLGVGNLHSVASALRHVVSEADVEITSDPKRVLAADRVVFPGVGAIRDCMAEIRRLRLDEIVIATMTAGKPLLAICVGLQALMTHSEENGGVPCMNYFSGDVKDFAGYPAFCERLKVPHMGWNQVRQVQSHPLWQGIPDNSRFYFVHSYCVQAEQAELVAGECHYGIHFNAALTRDNLFACQFHPEKSHTNGLKLLKNFVDWTGGSGQ